MTLLSEKTAFRFHADESEDPRDHDDKYRTLTLHPDGTFTDWTEPHCFFHEEWGAVY